VTVLLRFRRKIRKPGPANKLFCGLHVDEFLLDMFNLQGFEYELERQRRF
jgi:hypothetical protein